MLIENVMEKFLIDITTLIFSKTWTYTVLRPQILVY